MKNPVITLSKGKVLADGKPVAELTASDLKQNIVFFYDKNPGILWPAGWFFLNLVDTPENAKEVANGSLDKTKNLPIVFFPGTLSRAPNFPTIWRNKRYHKGIIAAVQGQMRGDKLHIEYMSVRPGYRRNKVMDKLITYLEEFFEPKMKEFHEVTKEGKAFLKGTKRNPYPADNELPEDFRKHLKNVTSWNFKLNVKGVSDDFWDPLTLEVVDGAIYGHVDGEDQEKNEYFLDFVEDLLTENPDTIPASRHGVIRGYLTRKSSKAIIREIIEKGMAQEGYKPKKNPVKTSPLQKKWLTGWGGSEVIAVYDIPPLEFLKLTCESPEHFKAMVAMKSPTQKSMEFYNQPEIQADMTVHPFLEIDDKGLIDAHEGRHRAAATNAAGEPFYQIAIVAEERGWDPKKYGWRWKRQLTVPKFLHAQYARFNKDMEYAHKVDESRLTYVKPYYPVEKNPIGQVLTKEDERLWKKAKKIVSKEYASGKPESEFTERNWIQVAGIYRNMAGPRATAKNPVISEADIEEGAKHELEHTKDLDIARKIALDHLKEDPCYYEKLKIVMKANPWPVGE